MSELVFGQLKGLPVNGNVVNVPAGHTLYAPGHVIQTVSATLSTTVSSTSTSFADIPGFSVNLTPKYATSKFLISTSMFTGTPNADTWIIAQLVRGASTVVASVASSRQSDQGIILNHATAVLDSPATTSPLTYKVQWMNVFSGTYYLNRRGFDAGVQGNSTITVQEIAA